MRFSSSCSKTHTHTQREQAVSLLSFSSHVKTWLDSHMCLSPPTASCFFLCFYFYFSGALFLSSSSPLPPWVPTQSLKGGKNWRICLSINSSSYHTTASQGRFSTVDLWLEVSVDVQIRMRTASGEQFLQYVSSTSDMTEPLITKLESS